MKKIFLSAFMACGLVACGGGSSSGVGDSSSGDDGINQGEKLPVQEVNNSPVASNVGITDVNGGATWAGDELVGSYTYSDAEGDVEGTTVTRWLVDGVEVATGDRYVSTKAEAGKSLIFEVTPIAVAGSITGKASVSQSFEIKRDLAFFTAGTLEKRNNLFVTDGTEAGTINLDVITNGPIGSKPVQVGDKWFFAIYDNDSFKMRLAETDGTPAGTKIFSEGPELNAPYEMAEFKGKLYFAGRDAAHGSELWVVDGTEAGARLFKDIDVSPNGGIPRNFTVVGDQMFFTAYLSYTGDELWVTNGDNSNDGTHLVKDFTQNNASANFGDLYSFNDKLYVVVAERLWVSDGTDAGTKQLNSELRPWRADNFITLNDHFYFTDSSISRNRSVWVSDGLTARPLHHSQKKNNHSINDLAIFNEKVYFISNNQLYEATADVAKKVELGELSVKVNGYTYLVALKDKLLFDASLADESNFELFQYDGAQVSLVKDITGDSSSSYPQQLILLNNEVLFRADDRMSGRELWKTDGSEAGTVLLKDIYRGLKGSWLNLRLGEKLDF
ncbi:hypothetical protein ACU6U9_18550 [Pseudomonas sp. HK3]